MSLLYEFAQVRRVQTKVADVDPDLEDFIISSHLALWNNSGDTENLHDATKPAFL